MDGKTTPHRTSQMPSGTTRFIDMQRGAFAFFVALGHLFDIAKVDTGYHGWLEIIRPCFGFQWVIGFFVLSGFCIESSVQNLAEKGAVRRYIELRITRIAPAYLAILGLAVAVELALLGSPNRPTVWPNVYFSNFAGQLIFIQGAGILGIAAFGCYASTFTITHEAFYYVLWTIRVKTLPRHLTIKMIIGIALFFLLTGFFAQKSGVQGVTFIFIYGCIWLFGVAALTYYRELYDLPILKWSTRMAPAFLLGGVGIYSFGFDPGLGWFFFLGLVFVLMLFGEYRWLSRYPKASAALGQISYPLFLIHGPVGIALGGLFNWLGGVSFWTQFGFMVATSVICSWIFAVRFEQPFLRYRRKKLGGFAHGRS